MTSHLAEQSYSRDLPFLVLKFSVVLEVLRSVRQLGSSRLGLVRFAKGAVLNYKFVCESQIEKLKLEVSIRTKIENYAANY